MLLMTDYMLTYELKPAMYHANEKFLISETIKLNVRIYGFRVANWSQMTLQLCMIDNMLICKLEWLLISFFMKSFQKITPEKDIVHLHCIFTLNCIFPLPLESLK